MSQEEVDIMAFMVDVRVASRNHPEFKNVKLTEKEITEGGFLTQMDCAEMGALLVVLYKKLGELQRERIKKEVRCGNGK